MKTVIHMLAATSHHDSGVSPVQIAPEELNGEGTLGALLRRAVRTSDLARTEGVQRRTGVVADDAREPAAARAVVQCLEDHLLVTAAYAGAQSWTRDPRGSEVQCYSPRIPHGKVTKWQSIRIRPCQEAIIG